MEEQRTCPYCGNQHRARAAFCPVTGKPLPPIEAAPAPTPVRTHCYNCNSPVEPNWRVCPNCGAQLADVRLPSAAPVQYPPQQNIPYPPQPQQDVQYSAPQPPQAGPQRPQAPYPPAQQPGGYAPRPRAPQPPRKNSKWLLGCSLGLLGGIALLAVICIASVLILGLNENNRTAKIVPAEDTRVFLSFSPTLLQLPSLVYADRLEKSLAVFGAVPGAEDLASVSQDDLFQNLDIDPQRDILPWVGNEVSLAVFDDSIYSRAPGGSQMVSLQFAPAGQYYGPAVLITAATRSTGASNRFLNKIYTQLEDEGAQINTYSYEDVDITEITSSGSTSMAVATYKGLVMVSMNSQVIEAAIDSAGQPRQSLYQQESFQDVIKHLPANRLGMMFMDTSAFMEGSGVISSVAGLGMNSVEALGGSFSLESSGLRFDYLLKYDTDKASEAELQALRETTSRNAMTGALPGEAIFYFSGQNISFLFESILRASNGDSDEEIQEMYDDFRSEYNVDLKADLLENMTEEYSLIFLPADPDTSSDMLPAGMAIAIQLKNTDQVARSVETLMRNLANESGYIFSDKDINGSPAAVVHNDYDSEYELGTVIRDNVLYIASTEDILYQLAESPKSSLASSGVFRAALRGLPSKERFYAVVDVTGVKAYAYEQMSPSERSDFDEEFGQYIEDLESLSFSVGRLDKSGIMHGQMRVNTK